MSESSAPVAESEVEPVRSAGCLPHTGSPHLPCSRCGTFVCSDCATVSEGLCANCRRRKLVDPARLKKRARIPSGLLYLLCVTSTMTLLDVGFGLAGSVSHTWPIVYAAATGLGLVFYLCIVVTFLRWKYFVTRAVNVLGHDVGVTPGWSVGIWFIPIFNLFLPYLAIRSMLVCVGGERALKESKLNVWWALWVLDKVMIIPYSPTEVPSPALSVMTELVVIGAALSAIKVVKTLTSGILNADVEATAVPQDPSLEAGGSPES